MRNILFLLFLFAGFAFSCTDDDYTTKPSYSFMADQPVKINYLGKKLWIYPVDLGSNDVKWGSYSINETGAISISDGKTNTDSIVSEHNSGNYAAYLCDTLNAYGYNDWYLPSKNELNAVYQHFSDKFSFFNNIYWSSTETSSDSAWLQDFSDGEQYIQSKSYYKYVICIRKDN